MSKAANPTIDRIHEVIAMRLAAAGQRYTTARESIVNVLWKSKRPVSMPELLQAAPGLAQSSAYRNLAVLSSVGLVHRIASSDDNGYFELADELVGTHHHHVICANCGQVGDVNSSPKLERALQEAAQIAMKETGYQIDAHRIDLVGKCVKCKRVPAAQ